MDPAEVSAIVAHQRAPARWQPVQQEPAAPW